jgi:hypothetical protein
MFTLVALIIMVECITIALIFNIISIILIFVIIVTPMCAAYSLNTHQKEECHVG